MTLCKTSVVDTTEEVTTKREKRSVVRLKDVNRIIPKSIMIIVDHFSLLPFELESWISKPLHLYVANEVDTVAWCLPPTVQVVNHIHLHKYDSIIINGSKAFIKAVLDKDQAISVPELNVVIVTARTRMRGALWKQWNIRWSIVKHSELGGISTSEWMIGIRHLQSTNKQYDPTKASFSLRRMLKDILKHDMVGTHVTSEDISTAGQKLQSHIQLQGLDTQRFVVPSFLSHNGWTLRTLSVFEIGQIFDISELLLNKLSEAKFCIKSTSFINMVTPGKVIQSVVNYILDVWGTASKTLPTQQLSNINKPLLLMPPAINESSNHDLENEYILSYGNQAAKDDDATIPVALWNGYVYRHFLHNQPYEPSLQGKAFDLLRAAMLSRYRQNIYKSFLNYIRNKYGKDWYAVANQHRRQSGKRKRTPAVQTQNASILRDLQIGRDALLRAINATYWEWSCGSTLFFWRWPSHVVEHARDGVPIYVEGKLPHYTSRQRWPPEDEKGSVKQMKQKLQKVIDRGYLAHGYVKSLTSYFPVPKGLQDIRIVYDGTKSKLNEAVWAPNFFLPSIDSLLMFCDGQTWFADIDLGEMFLNYFMDLKLRPYSGVDVSKLHPGRKAIWFQWLRTFMGLCPSPFNACKMFAITVDVIRGDKTDPDNPFKWTHVETNYPGSDNYDPSKPWCRKYYFKTPAGDLEVYVDDVRPFGPTESSCHAIRKRAAQILQYLGQQDASRKYRPPSQRPGPWCGAFMASVDDNLYTYASESKWIKARTLVDNIILELDENLTDNPIYHLNHKQLEKSRGFLVYLTQTYPSLNPYLKGIHLTLDSWRPHRDDDGWKLNKRGGEGSGFSPPNQSVVSKDRLMNDQAHQSMNDDANQDDIDEEFILERDTEGNYVVQVPHHLRGSAPTTVKAVPRLSDDLTVLQSFLHRDQAPWRFVRGNNIVMVLYGFGDAAKSGFGASFQTTEGIWYRIGVWGDDGESESSNFRELCNLVETLEVKLNSEELKGHEIFFFTDNSTAESAFYRGTSKSKKLFELVRRLHKIELDGGCIIRLIHVSGSRMISQGTDGLSRGDTGEGIMGGKPMLSFVPLHLSAVERSPPLKEWLLDTFGMESIPSWKLLKEGDWFDVAHDIVGGCRNQDGIWIPHTKAGSYIWAPPPAGGQVAVEQLRRARLKSQSSYHIFVIPRLYTSIWRRQLRKAADLVIELPFLPNIWSKDEQHEPLTLAFLFPFIHSKPWQLKRAPAFLGMERVLRGMWKESGEPVGPLLRKLFGNTTRLGSMPELLVRKMLQNERGTEFLCASDGE